MKKTTLVGGCEESSDPSETFPWSPLIKDKEKAHLTPEARSDTPHPHKSKFSPRFQSKSSIAFELSPISEEPEPDAPQFDLDNLPWSPLRCPPLDIACIFGNYRHPLVEKIIPLLQLKHNINLILRASEPPPKPFPIFYIYTEGDNIPKVLRVGNTVSEGHCILIFPDDKKLPSNFAEIECTKLQIKFDQEDYDIKDLENLCQQMSDCTNKVYAKGPSPQWNF